ncbi:hypothetical protein BH09PSE2_BH09PSE2_11190 [soil metagenome]
MRQRALLSAILIAVALPATAGAGVVTVPIDHSTRLSIRGPAASLVVGNPSLADVTLVDSHTVFVSGRGFGSTDVTILDSLGRTIFSSDILVSAPTQGRVSVYRGPTRSDLACDPGCAPNGRATAGAAAPTFGGGSGKSSAVTAAQGAAAMPITARPPFAAALSSAAPGAPAPTAPQ